MSLRALGTADDVATRKGDRSSLETKPKEEPSGALRPRDKEILFAIVLFVVAFALRFAAARWLAGEPVWDGHYYDFGAKRIAGGHGYSDDRVVDGVTEWHPWCHYPVGYSAYLAAFYVVLGTAPWVAHFANALSGALVSVVVFLLAREGLSLQRARVAGVITALHPGLVLYGALVMGEVLSALTVMFAFWVAIFCARRWPSHPLRGVALGALVLGVSALVRPQALLCAPFLGLVLVLPARARHTPSEEGEPRASALRRAILPFLRGAVVASVLALVPVLPWTARNCAVMDGCALVSTNAGWNLAIGSFPRATGRFETLRSSDGCREVTGQVQQDRCWLEYGIANIKATPGRWLGLIPAKLSNTFDHESFAVEYLREARPQEWPEDKRVAWRMAITSLHRVLVVLSPLAFVALRLPRRRRDARAASTAWIAQGALVLAIAIAAYVSLSASTPTFWPIVIATCVLAWLPIPGHPPIRPAILLPITLLVTTALTHAIFFGDDRYHMVVTPALCLLVAAAFRPSDLKHARRGHPPDVRAARSS